MGEGQQALLEGKKLKNQTKLPLFFPLHHIMTNTPIPLSLGTLSNQG